MTPVLPVPRFELTETGPGIVRRLTGGQLAMLMAVPELVGLAPAAGGQWRIRGNQKVGLVRLGRGADALEVLIRPKLAISHLLFLIGYAPHDPWHRDTVELGTAEDLLPAVAELFARTVRRTLETGVLYGYRTVEEDLTVVRGRIRTTDQLRRTGLPLPVAVRYDDHSPDIPENRILLGALHHLELLPGIAPATRTLLRHLAGRLAGVRPPIPGEPLPVWAPNRLNARYRSALRLAELVLAGRAVQPEGPAALQGDGFLLDMPRVFENFLASALGDALRGHGVRCAAQETRHRLDQAGRVRLRPDLVLYRAGQPAGVVDAKYKALNASVPPTEHLYQLLSYCTALGLPAGHLVYAGGSAAPSAAAHTVRGSGAVIHAHTLDLGQPPADLLAAVTGLARVLAPAGDPDSAATAG
ncbi:McrC family protein [Kitasatospora mediocidica]|uniref:McrC family protein n=1 Tax=Kitasatospora mediocidica TaxID=58352 RepID=UPI00055C9BF3|nr:McrBC 5-methylcytosine restriction system component-like protein [Kitasatospora mediocidica]